MRRLSALLIVPTVAILCLSCSEEKKGTDIDPTIPFLHEAPSILTMQVDTEDLAQEEPLGPSGVCHFFSAVVVFWVDANVVFRLAIPVGAFAGCLLQDPVFVGDDTWRWTAQGGFGVDAHTDELTAHVLNGSQIEWSMRISGTRFGLDRFLWFDGLADSQAQEGDWHFYDHNEPLTSREVLTIDWMDHRNDDGVVEVAFENVDPDAVNFGDRLIYRTVDSEASITFMDREGDVIHTANMHWDRLTGSGMWSSAEGDSCCWGERPDFLDIDCP